MCAFNELVRAHTSVMLAYATRLTGDRHTAEDVVQEAWMRAWRRADRLTGDIGCMRSWLMRITHNAAMDVHRHRTARPAEVQLPDMVIEQTGRHVPSHSEEVDVRLDLTAVLNELPDLHRDTLMAVYYEDHTAKSAATVLGVPVGTVKSRVHNGLHMLRGTARLGLAAA